jgi:hypothetical protein
MMFGVSAKRVRSSDAFFSSRRESVKGMSLYRGDSDRTRYYVFSEKLHHLFIWTASNKNGFIRWVWLAKSGGKKPGCLVYRIKIHHEFSFPGGTPRFEGPF